MTLMWPSLGNVVNISGCISDFFSLLITKLTCAKLLSSCFKTTSCWKGWKSKYNQETFTWQLQKVLLSVYMKWDCTFKLSYSLEIPKSSFTSIVMVFWLLLLFWKLLEVASKFEYWKLRLINLIGDQDPFPNLMLKEYYAAG